MADAPLNEHVLDPYIAPDERLALDAAAQRGDMRRFGEIWLAALMRIAHSGQPGARELVLSMLTDEGKRNWGLE